VREGRERFVLTVHKDPSVDVHVVGALRTEAATLHPNALSPGAAALGHLHHSGMLKYSKVRISSTQQSCSSTLRLVYRRGNQAIQCHAQRGMCVWALDVPRSGDGGQTAALAAC
jgi:hypothetical protein